ncbi:MAG: hypothetical protein OEY29_02040 [Gammaproteobacteria bacterium]|nr:hypothetical protein [Gammaproteobacteria bacterium]
MNKIMLLISISVSLFSTNALAFDIFLGVESGAKSVTVKEPEFGNEIISTVKSEPELSPSFTFRSKEKYFSEKSKWAYHFQVDAAEFDVNMQQLQPTAGLVNLGTSLDGYSLYALPVVYYHFNKNLVKKWTYRAGFGLGIGYMKLDGNFKITDPGHPQYNQIKAVQIKGYGSSVGLYFEATYKRHMIVLQSYGPVLTDEPYQYHQVNTVLAYRYKFDFFKSDN